MIQVSAVLRPRDNAWVAGSEKDGRIYARNSPLAFRSRGRVLHGNGGSRIGNDVLDGSEQFWCVAAQSSSGMQLVQRNSLIFATLYVYDTNRKPTWFVATLTYQGSISVWQGDLLATTGPWFGTTPFNPASSSCARPGRWAWTPAPRWTPRRLCTTSTRWS